MGTGRQVFHMGPGGIGCAGKPALLFLVILIATPGPVFAGHAGETPDRDGQASTEKKSSFFKEFLSTADTAHEKASKGVLATGRWLDSFFKREIYQVEDNRSTAELGMAALIEEGEDVNFSTISNLKLVLPQFDRRLHLLFADKEEAEEIHEESERSAVARYFLKATKEESISADGGMNVYGFKPIFSWKARYRKTVDFQPWKARFTQQLKWFSNAGYELQTTFDFERPLRRNFFFRTTLNGEWYARKYGYYYSLAFVLFHPFDENQAMFYEWSASFVTTPVDRLEEVAFRIKYKLRSWSKRIDMVFAPQLAFRRERNFEYIPGFYIKLELNLGHVS